ncbi:hypothetical protein VN12_07210 [Pirellula sp. SH-Sr6A]|uniref:hypothetical protein n=1 Tax=Pirellula sp. SH-Sr6A TaxID=1632865 RepID=UPI00078B6949|nr:hypothetical protein [Pirellula sp. SH-Sr6A]AMV31892.1 hypothetical protein VN12_07210 [Pirellula sp. SH-Sr6A]
MKREEIVMCDELEEVIRWQSQTKFDSLHSHHLFSPHPLRLGALARNFLQNQEVSRKGAKLAKGKQEMKREEIVMCDEL